MKLNKIQLALSISLVHLSYLFGSFLVAPPILALEVKEEEKTVAKRIQDIIKPPPPPVTQGENFCFIFPRTGEQNYRTYSPNPLFIWQGIASSLSIKKRGEVIWATDDLEQTQDENAIQSFQYSIESPLEPGSYDLNLVLSNGEQVSQHFYLDYELESPTAELNIEHLNTDLELLKTTLIDLKEQDRLWEANQVIDLSLALMSPTLLTEINQEELNLSRKALCEAEQESNDSNN